MLVKRDCIRARAAGASAGVWRPTTENSVVGAVKAKGEKEAAMAT